MVNENKDIFLQKVSLLNSNWKVIERNLETDHLGLFLEQQYQLPTILAPFLKNIGIIKITLNTF